MPCINVLGLCQRGAQLLREDALPRLAAGGIHTFYRSAAVVAELLPNARISGTQTHHAVRDPLSHIATPNTPSRSLWHRSPAQSQNVTCLPSAVAQVTA